VGTAHGSGRKRAGPGARFQPVNLRVKRRWPRLPRWGQKRVWRGRRKGGGPAGGTCAGRKRRGVRRVGCLRSPGGGCGGGIGAARSGLRRGKRDGLTLVNRGCILCASASLFVSCTRWGPFGAKTPETWGLTAFRHLDKAGLTTAPACPGAVARHEKQGMFRRFTGILCPLWVTEDGGDQGLFGPQCWWRQGTRFSGGDFEQSGDVRPGNRAEASGPSDGGRKEVLATRRDGTCLEAVLEKPEKSHKSFSGKRRRAFRGIELGNHQEGRIPAGFGPPGIVQKIKKTSNWFWGWGDRRSSAGLMPGRTQGCRPPHVFSPMMGGTLPRL